MSGSKTKIQALYSTIFEKQKLAHLEGEDVETVTGLLKYGLQSLAEPLFTFALYDSFVEASSTYVYQNFRGFYIF